MTDWMTDAACTQVDPELFFADDEEGWKPSHTALRICAGCPVKLQCLAASSADDRWSVRGGLTAGQRRQLRVNAA